jgi:ABC-type bacteriocin/lantibiotic exporter with double-glycine peptidase domain
MPLKVPYQRQTTEWNCGPAVLSSVFASFGIEKDQRELAQELGTKERTGTARRALEKVTRKYGLAAKARTEANFDLIEEALEKKRPVIVNFVEPSDEEGHYAVAVYLTPQTLVLNDPWNGKDFKIKRREFASRWRKRNNWMMTVSAHVV